MNEPTSQIHHKFKAFSGALAPDHTLGALAAEVSAWVREARVAPKSIGVEFIESAARLVFTIGYRDDEPAYEVEIRSVPLGKIDGLGDGELRVLEQAMAKASASVPAIICHEIYVTAENEFVMVFMAYQPS